MDQHYEDDTDRDCPLQGAELQLWCDLSSCTLADVPPSERLVEVTATSAVLVFFFDEPLFFFDELCFNVLNQRSVLCFLVFISLMECRGFELDVLVFS